jgi:phenylacetic acid degradation operon negative regulatory protein
MKQSRNTISTPQGADLLERPLSPRSVVASLLLGMHPPRIRGALLVRWCGLFGIAEGTTRVALSRMVAAGELRTNDGVYELAGRVRSRQETQDWALAPDLRPWDGRWVIHVVTADARSAADRAALREAAPKLRLAEQREGVWVRPDNLPDAASPRDARAVFAAQCRAWRAEPDGDAAALARGLFAVEAWSAKARRLATHLRDGLAPLAAGDERALAEGFVAGAAALVHLRADPLLPLELLPDDWPGDDLRAAYLDYQPAFGDATRRWFRSAA